MAMPDRRDDRLLVPTRWVNTGIVPVLSAAFVILYLFPDRTRQLWAWTIAPTMTPMMMGAGYLAGAYFFAESVRGRRWHRASAGMLGAAVFATLLGVATFAHWDKFNHGHVSFWAWIGLYVATPLLLPWLWVNNRRTDNARPDERDATVPLNLRKLMATVGAAQLLWALVIFAIPEVAIDVWAWKLTPLTARTVAAFLAFPAVILLGFVFDDRWSSFRIPVRGTTFGLVLLLAGVPRGWDGMKSDGAGWAYACSLVVGIAFLLVVQVKMEKAVTGHTAMPPPSTSSPA